MLPVTRLSDNYSDNDTQKEGSGNVFVNGMAGVRLSDKTTGHSIFPCTWASVPTVSGSGSVFINGLPLIRLTDTHAVHCCTIQCHDGEVSTGSGNVFCG